MSLYYATEFGSVRPTDFTRAIAAAEREADSRQADSAVYENGQLILLVHPAQQMIQKATELESAADLLDTALLAPSMKSRTLREQAQALRDAAK